jgi:hypothetical protein
MMDPVVHRKTARVTTNGLSLKLQNLRVAEKPEKRLDNLRAVTGNTVLALV